jgi:hypothetical protein
MRATLSGGPFDETVRDVDDQPPDVVLCTDRADPTLEHLYRLRRVERTGDAARAVYDYAPEAGL